MVNNKARLFYVGLSFIVLIGGVWVTSECNRRYAKKPALLTFEKVQDFNFTSHEGLPIGRKDLKNKVYVLAFFFTSCPDICPKMIGHKLRLQDKFYSRPDFAMVSITIDPKRDDPKVLRDYRKDKGITLHQWYMLTGDEDTIYDFANNGFKLHAKKDGDEFFHSGLFALVDKKGYIRSRSVMQNGNSVPLKYYDGLDPKAIQMLKEDIKILLEER